MRKFYSISVAIRTVTVFLLLFANAATAQQPQTVEVYKRMDPWTIRGCQTTVNDEEATAITNVMLEKGFAIFSKDPSRKDNIIDVVEMPDGEYTSADNKRLVAAKIANVPVYVRIHRYNASPGSASDKERLLQISKGKPVTTWGEAITARIKDQSKGFSSQYPNGSYALPRFNVSAKGNETRPADPATNKPLPLFEILPQYRQKEARTNVKSNSEKQKINTILSNSTNNKFPGGIIINPQPEMSLKINSVTYNADDGLFRINKNYSYDCKLADDEISIIWHAVFNIGDNKFGALSQKEFLNIPENSFLAKFMADADNLLGKIAYGYDTRGESFEKEFVQQQYQNPLEVQLNSFNNINSRGIIELAMLYLSNVQPRLFMYWDNVRFIADETAKIITPSEASMSIQYQSFTQDENGNVIYMEKSPDNYFPHIAQAIKHLEKNYAWYENRIPQFYKVRKIAELYAFFRYLKLNSVPFSARAHFQKTYEAKQKLQPIFESYQNISPSSALTGFYYKAFPLLEKSASSFTNPDQKFAVNYLLFVYALNADLPEKAKLYRQKAMSLVYRVFPRCTESAVFKINLEKALMGLTFYGPSSIISKFLFAQEQVEKNPALAKQYMDEVFNWYNKYLSADDNAYGDVYYVALTGKKLNKPDQVVKKMEALKRQKIEVAAKQGDSYAQYLLADEYLNNAEVRDEEKGKYWMLESSKNCNRFAQTFAGGWYRDGKYNLPQNNETALSLFKKSADQGYSWGAYHTALLYEAKKEFSLAFEYFKKAADRGIEQAKQRLPDYTKAGYK